MKNILSAAAFANAAASTAPTAGKPAATTATDTGKRSGGAPKAADRVAPQFTAPRTDVPRPVSAGPGAKSQLAAELQKLEVNQSIGLVNKTKKQISSTISKLNGAETNQKPKLGADGVAVTKAGEPIKDAAGVVIGHGQPVPVMERIKEFEAFETDPKTDADGAIVRVFRNK